MTILYHYCPTSSFHSIIHSQAIWLTSLSQSNDYMEGKLVSYAIERLARRDKLKEIDVIELQQWLKVIESQFDGLGFCLSEVDDLLSQWRGYASDATGVAIGFSNEYLEWLVTTDKETKLGTILNKVSYSQNEHDALVEPTYLEVKQLMNDEAHMPPRVRNVLDTRTEDEIQQERVKSLIGKAKIFTALRQIYPKLFLLKQAAFKEEKEWRLISYLDNDANDVCSYYLRDRRIVPYRSIDLMSPGIRPIVKVILGPKHLTPVYVVKNFLYSYGFDQVQVIPSAASYR
jgi:hypothetical protein